MSSGSKVKTGEPEDRRMYANAKSSPTNFPPDLHDKNYLQGAQGFLKSSAADVKSPSPCRGSRASSAEIMPIPMQTAVQLKNDIMKEIKTELAEPIKDMLSNIIGEIQALKLKTDTARTCRDISCQTEFLGNVKDEDLVAECNTIGEREIVQHLSGLESPDFLANEIETGMSTSAVERPVPSPRMMDRNQTSSVAQRPTQMLNKFSLQRRGQIVQVRPRQKSEVHPTRVHSVDKRECLANALQFHVEDLVDGLVFHESELLDSLVTENCLTQDECGSVRKNLERKDQIRVLLSLIKGRDLSVLERFLKHVKEHNQAVARKIAEKFESNLHNGITGKLCALCKLEREFNVKHVADSLWSIQVIDDGIYNKIIHSDAPVGAQSTLWEKIFLSINCLNCEDSELAHTKLLQAISKNNLFTHLETQFDEMLKKTDGKLICSCQSKSRSLKQDSLVFPLSKDSDLPDTHSTSNVGTNNSKDLVFQDGRETGAASVAKLSGLSIETEEQIKHGSDCSGNTKPPALPKRPSSFAEKPSKEHLSMKMSSIVTDFSKASSQTMSSRNISSSHSTKLKDNSEVPISKEIAATRISSTIAKTSTETSDTALGKIPPLPVKKNKYPAWKKVDQHGPSYV